MQLSFFPEIETTHIFPSTRYQGSKAKFVEWIRYYLSKLDFQTALDAFGGSGSVSYILKDCGKQVTYNDILPFNAIIGKALIENSDTTLQEFDVDSLLIKQSDIVYPSFIADNFHNIYYTDEENAWLDVVTYNIKHIKNEYKQAIAWFALFQSCIIKRPYNLFHRKNLYVRLSNVDRSFGNKKTWDTPFEIHFRKFVNEANRSIFNNGLRCKATNFDALLIDNHYDLVYIDTPYLNSKGIGVDYADFYHFLNGLVDYENWRNRIDYGSKHLRLKREYSIWNDKENIIKGFYNLIENFSESILVFSYRSNGIPEIGQIVSLLNRKGRQTDVFFSKDIKYALSDTKSREVLIVSRP